MRQGDLLCRSENYSAMKFFISIVVVVVIAGCTSNSPQASAEFERRCADVAGQEVKLPSATPFDDDPARRAIYLEWY